MTTLIQHLMIDDPCGLHARPASQLVRIFCQYEVNARISLGQNEADGKSLLALLLLNARQGTVLTVRVAGTRAAEAIAALQQQFAVPAAVSG